jgi:DNA transformation protein
MAVSGDFLAFVIDQLRALDGVRARRMFGGAGLYSGRRMFGLIADDTLYLRPGEATRPEFDRLATAPFRYRTAAGQRTVPAFRQVPETVLEDAHALAIWAGAAIRASPPPRRAAPAKQRRRRRIQPLSTQK